MEDKIRRWAFGSNHNSLHFCNEDLAWNKRHSDLFVMRPEDPILDVYRKIEAFYYLNKFKVDFMNGKKARSLRSIASEIANNYSLDEKMVYQKIKEISNKKKKLKVK